MSTTKLGQQGARHRPPAFSVPARPANAWVNALVVGGDAQWRVTVARGLHRASPVAKDAFLALDPNQDREALQRALGSWLRDPQCDENGVVVEAGTLYIDPLTDLTLPVQSALLSVAERISDHRLPTGAPVRIIAGCADDPWLAVDDGRLLNRLCDCLDKFRVEARPRFKRSVA